MNLRTTSAAGLFILATTLASTSFGQVAPVLNPIDPVKESFEFAHPNTGMLRLGDQLARVYGTFSTGKTPSDSADAFVQRHAKELYGVDAANLAPIGPFEDGAHLLPLMPLEGVDGFKFTAVYYQQQVRGIPVYRAGLIVLTRNDTDFPSVLASSTLWDVTGVESQLAGVTVGKLPDARIWARGPAAQFRATPEFGPAQYVIWAGVNRAKASPRLAVMFTAEGGSPADPDNHQRIEFVVDARTGKILHQETKIHEAVTGQVTGQATTGYQAAACQPEVATGLPYVRVVTGGTTTYADATGNFSIAAGASGATYTSSLVGRYFTTTNNGAATLSLSTTASDGAAWSPQFNAANTSDTDRAQVNAYIMANKTRDMVLSVAPSFPTVSTQTNSFRVNCNLAQTCNAYYSNNTINFYSAGGGCNNTAFGDVVCHEYGHNCVEKAGSGQGEYGEGMGDVCGLLLSDDARTGVGFQSCGTGIRTASNTCQFASSGCSTCGSEIHACGQLISGCVWDLRNRFAAAYPTTYRTKLQSLAVNSMPLHGAISTIASDITIDYLTLDDDNGNIADGTPNYNMINDSFAVHGLPGPAISVLKFTYPNGIPTTVGHYGGTELRVQVDPLLATPNYDTVRLYSKASAASTWAINSMFRVAGTTNVFAVSVPPGTCGDIKQFYVACNTTSGAVVTDPSNAPSSFKTASIVCTDPLPADLNADGSVNGADLGILLSNWGNPGIGDLNHDNIVDGSDLGILLASWG